MTLARVCESTRRQTVGAPPSQLSMLYTPSAERKPAAALPPDLEPATARTETLSDTIG